jgi:hypothetical protein
MPLVALSCSTVSRSERVCLPFRVLHQVQPPSHRDNGTGSKECAYFTFEKSATILASVPS